MTAELTAEEMELVLHALKAYGKRKEEEGVPRIQVDNLVARLEVVEREHRGERPDPDKLVP